MNNEEMNEKIGGILGYTVKQLGGWYVLMHNGTTVINNKVLAITCKPEDIPSIYPNWSGDFELCYRDLNIENHYTNFFTSKVGAIVVYENEITGSKTSFASNLFTPALICSSFLSMNGIERYEKIFRGVYIQKQTNTWRAEIYVDGVCIIIGFFDNKVDAARAYNSAAIKFYGELALLNEGI